MSYREGVDELAVVVWLCMWLDLMDPARKAFFEPLPVVPVSQRVLMDKLMVLSLFPLAALFFDF